MIGIRNVSPMDAPTIGGLCDLLVDVVHGGASVGFLAPLSLQTAHRYWEQVLPTLDRGTFLWVAEDEGRVVGSVQLATIEKENGRHRAEIQKLLVSTTHRGQGIASRLMTAAESHAASLGRTLLVLDTEVGSVAETVYRHLGWQKAGEIPSYATTPRGRLHATAYYYKLDAP